MVLVWCVALAGPLGALILVAVAAEVAWKVKWWTWLLPGADDAEV